ncbi:hypothetical protein [Spiroplasma ixodetis]|nr:hypothetical protein [Spiroplasma ixodetis]
MIFTLSIWWFVWKVWIVINLRTSPHMYLWRKQWNWMSSTMLFKQNRIV